MNPYTERYVRQAMENEACNNRHAARQIVRKVENTLSQSFPGIQAHLIGSVSVNGHGSDVDILIGPAPGEDEWRGDDMQAAIVLLAKEFGMASVSKDYGQGASRGRYYYDMVTGRSESKMLNFILVSRGVERWLKADDLLRFIASTGQHVFKGVRVGVHRMIVDEAAPC